MERSLWCLLLLTFLLADFRGPVSPQDDIINQAYSDLYPGQNLLFSPLPPTPPTLCGAGTNIALVTLAMMGTLATFLTLLQDKHKVECPSRLPPVSALDQERASDLLPVQQTQTHISPCEGQGRKKRLSLLLTLIPLGVIGMLLIVAGDVEQNPGPGHKSHGQLQIYTVILYAVSNATGELHLMLLLISSHLLTTSVVLVSHNYN